MSSGVVFTTHTPVPAGHDRFPANLVEEHLGPIREALGLSFELLPDGDVRLGGGEPWRTVWVDRVPEPNL